MKYAPRPAYRESKPDTIENVTQVPKLAYCKPCCKRRTEATGKWIGEDFYCAMHKTAGQG